MRHCTEKMDVAEELQRLREVSANICFNLHFCLSNLDFLSYLTIFLLVARKFVSDIQIFAAFWPVHKFAVQ